MLLSRQIINSKNIKKEIFLLFLFACMQGAGFAQSSFRKLSRPEKCWVIIHPVRAMKALKVTKKVQIDVDSVKKNGVVGNDNTGGALDAFKHAYWMGMLAAKIGKKQALKLGKAHEKGNYLEFKKRLLEDNALPDSVSSVMDLRNNEIGATIGQHCKCSAHELKNQILKKVTSGELGMIQKDRQGNYLDCSGSEINMKIWVGKWNIPKCLIASRVQ